MRFALALGCAIGLIGPAPPAEAGAWLREHNAWLLSLAHEQGRDTRTGAASTYTTFYGEYGLTPGLTLGLDAGQGDSDDGPEAMVFLRMGAASNLLPGQLSFMFGLGRGTLPVLGMSDLISTGVSWGKGWETRIGGAWVNLDATTDYYPKAVAVAYGLDATLGLKPSDRTMVTLEIWAKDPVVGAQTVQLAPSVHRRMGDKTWLRLGATKGVKGDDTTGLVLGTWLEF